MMSVPFVDKQGYYIEDVLVTSDTFKSVLNRASVDRNPVVMGYTVGYPIPEGLYEPRLDVDRLKKEYKSDDGMKWYDGDDPEIAKTYWIEGLTQEEITERTKPAPLTEFEQFKQQTAEQQAAMWDFILSGGM